MEVEEAEVEDVVDEELIDSNFRRSPHCQKQKHKKSLNRHIRLVHLNIKVKCDQCGLQLTDMVKLRLHMTKVHEKGAEGDVKCTFCEQMFIDKQKKKVRLYHRLIFLRFITGKS